jgi:LemA protein
MWSSPLFWIAFATALFWALGAYNRLMRLRSAVAQSFGSLDAHVVRLVSLLGEYEAAHETDRDALAGSVCHETAALHGATTQLSASLAVARARPLQPSSMAALAAARDVLLGCWHNAQRKAQERALIAAPAGAAGETLPGSFPSAALWQSRWNEHARQNDQAIHVFNDAVEQYNAAIRQFPASILAWTFGFKAARGL